MARISTYAQDPNLEGQDRVIGSDVSNANATMNFSLNSLGDFFTSSGIADATRLGYRFMITDTGNSSDPRPGTGSLFFGNDSSFAFSSLESIRISATDLANWPTSVLDNFISGQRVKIISTRNTRGQNAVGQGFYTVDNIEEITQGTVVVGYQLDLTAYVDSADATKIGQTGNLRFTTGVLEPDTEFIVVPLPGGSGTGDGRTGADGLPVSIATGAIATAITTVGDQTAQIGDTIITFGTTETPNIGQVVVQRGERGLQGPAGMDSTVPGPMGDPGAPGAAGRGITSITDADGDGTATVVFTDGTTSQLPLPRGLAGADGDGWTGVTYDASTGFLTFTSDDGLGFVTTDIRGTNGTDGASVNRVEQLANDASGNAVIRFFVEDAAGMESQILADITVPRGPQGPAGGGVDPFDNTLQVAPSHFQETGAANTWVLSFRPQTNYTYTITSVSSPNANFPATIAGDSQSVTISAADTVPATTDNVTITYTLVNNNVAPAITTMGLTSHTTIGLRDGAPPTPGTFTIHSGVYDTVGSADPAPAFPTVLQGAAREINSGDTVMFTATGTAASDDYAVIQIETIDFTTVEFVEIVDAFRHTLEQDSSETAVTGFTSYRFPFGGEAGDIYTIQINIS